MLTTSSGRVAQIKSRWLVIVSEGVLAPGLAISRKRVSSFPPWISLLGYHVNWQSATIRPQDRAIDKLFFVLFSFCCSDPQPLVLWQCLSSLVNMYSHVIRGMRPFVAAIIHMTCRASGHHNQRACASAWATFALKCGGRQLFFWLQIRVPLEMFLVASGVLSLHW
jgi:hypothetical protein